MPRYLCLQRSVPGAAPSPAAPSPAAPSPAEMQEMYRQFNEWRERFRDNVVDLGGQLGRGQVALHSAAPDGPLVEVKELVGGYMVLSAASLEEAVEVARQCPGLVSPRSGVEVIEIRTPG